MKYPLFVAFLSSFLSVGVPNSLPPAEKDHLPEQVQKAIEKGKKFLRDKQIQDEKLGSHWEIDFNSKARPGGWTSLAVLALLSAGEGPNSEVIQKSLKYLREIESKDTYVVGLQTMVFAEAGFAEDKGRIQRNVDWLVKARVIRGEKLQGWGYRDQAQGVDNSNTRFAVLGLSAARTAGAKIEKETWQSVRDFYIRTQEPAGEWFYFPGYKTGSVTMTSAGVTGLLLGTRVLKDGPEVLRPDKTIGHCGGYPDDDAIAKAQTWLTDKYSLEVRSHQFYWLDCQWRLGQASGYRFIREHDWFREGCEYLVKNQQEDGSWYLRGQGFDAWPVISTSLALTYLSKGRTSVLVSKLVHGPLNDTSDSNRTRHDLYHLTEFARKQLFKNQPLAWQVFNCREVLQADEKKVGAMALELLQSPIAFVSGHEGPVFTKAEKVMLKNYIERGGFLLAEACCDDKRFDAGFRALMKELFPDVALKAVPADHPLWTAHAKVPAAEFKLEAIEIKGRLAVVYSPQDLACLWEVDHQAGRGQLAFRLGANIIAYATGGEMPKPWGVEVTERRPKPR